MIAPRLTVLGRMHKFSNTKAPIVLQGEKEVKQVRIQNDSWIDTNTAIMPKLKIAKGTILGAGSIFYKGYTLRNF
jgi:maltose O-acetyltransferase